MELSDSVFGESDDEAGELEGDAPEMVEEDMLDDASDVSAREPESPSEVQEDEHIIIMDAEVGRHFIPWGSDGEVYVMKLPSFIRFESKAFDLQAFMSDAALDHKIRNNQLSDEEYNQIMHTVRWWRDKDDPTQLRSNARILRWDNGDLTLQFLQDPDNQYMIDAHALAPSQPSGQAAQPKYDHRLDSRVYLAAPSVHNEFLRVTNHITSELRIQPGAAEEELAARRLLQSKLKGEDSRGGVQMHGELRNPEYEIRADLELVREKARNEKKKQLMEERLVSKTADVHRRGAGLSASDFGAASQRQAGPKKRRSGMKGGRGGRGGERLDDSESEGEFRKRTKDDEYDREDDFIAESDEEAAEGEDEEEEEEDDEDDEDEAGDIEMKGGSKGLAKRAGGEDTGAPPIQSIERDTAVKPAKRKVIDDDDE